ncbi:cysteine desulfurase family protein [Labrys wisconsinensis]|uniref:Cysteine desulfurase n=1 Tax=Labrys wisconsinensis TaxID=425677 RepID=A0ABU0J6N1_9HYPH|nr:cysteine desulfurase family protein [Labrys wisconsinensis]MDQ0468857.1 cysteine desulfurase [Labrys wisconsinensis]
MTGSRLYLDHNATTPLRPEARAAMLAALDVTGSASSVHAEGRAARRIVEEAREKVASLVGAAAKAVVFVSGATEANATALTPHWRRGPADRPLEHCLVSAVEHASVLAGGRFAPDRVEMLPVDGAGRADLPAWSARMADLRQANERPLVSLMLANNETGVLQPVAALAEAVQAAGGVLHADAAQAAGKIAISMATLRADLLTLSGHKLGGPFGSGALVLASEALHLAEPLIAGGGQERGARAGTENLPAIAGFGAAAEAAARDLAAEAVRQRALQGRLEAGLGRIAPDVVVFGQGAERLPNTICFAVPGIPAETTLMALDLQGVAVSSGSACSSGKVRASHVLKAMAVVPDLASGAIRVSLGRSTAAEDVERFLAVFHRVHRTIYEKRRMRAA